MTDLIDTVPTKDGLCSNVDERLYHADTTSLSVTGAKLLLPPSCPAKFKQWRDTPQEPKPHFDFGHVVHTLVLGKGVPYEPLDPKIHGLKRDGTVADNPTATTAWKQAEERARAEGKTPIHIDDENRAKDMAEAVYKHPVAGRIFAEGYPEVALYHHDEETGIRLRCKVDWLAQRGQLILADLKTSITANPTELERLFWKFNYHCQAAWYIDLAKACGLSDDPVFRFAVVEKQPPHLVTVVEYGPEDIAEGRRLNREAIRTYAECVRTDTWPSYPGADIVQRISLPEWAYTDEMEIPA